MLGVDVKFVTGTDEHGQKIEKSAEKIGMEPQGFVDDVSDLFRQLLPYIGVNTDDFIRTTEERHKKAVRYFWRKLKDAGFIYLGEYSGWYDVRNEAFFSEEELVNGKSPLGGDVHFITEPCYFFKLSAFENKLLELYKKNQDFIYPKQRMNEVVSFVKSGLKDLAVSRTTFKWGIPVADDPDHIVYVWLDALVNYLSVNGYPDNLDQNNDKYWRSVIHFVGKEIVRFHAVYWPAFLMAAGISLPRQVIAHGWWLSEGEKMSKSLGNVICPVKYSNNFGSDALRYFLVREISFGEDGNFTLDGFVSRYNSFLSNAYGNLCKRVLSFIYKNCETKVFRPKNLQQSDIDFKNGVKALLMEAISCLQGYGFHKYLEKIESAVALANQYIDHQKPWSLVSSDQARANDILYILVEAIYKTTKLLYPVIPKAALKVLAQINISYELTIDLEEVIPGEVRVNEPESVFPKIDLSVSGNFDIFSE
jgi:methionyl-tRNA synthetase